MQLFSKITNEIPRIALLCLFIVYLWLIFLFWFWGSPWNLGVGYRPIQPQVFSHSLHAGELSINCYYCHSYACKAEMAGLPSFSVCKECHDLLVHSNHNIWKSSIMQDSDLNNIFNLSKKGYDYKNRYFEILGRGFTKIQLKESILNGWGFFLDHGHWVKVHKLPEYVYFNHSAHIRTGIGCTNCHGEIKEMEEAQTVQPLSMRWCIDCHRKPVIYQEGRKFFINESANPPITDCYGCHR